MREYNYRAYKNTNLHKDLRSGNEFDLEPIRGNRLIEARPSGAKLKIAEPEVTS